MYLYTYIYLYKMEIETWQEGKTNKGTVNCRGVESEVI